MSLAIVITCIVLYTILVTGLVAYWLHRVSVRRLNLKFKTIIEELVGVLSDDPRYTVSVKTNYGKHKPNKAVPYNWAVDETFDNIIDKNFPQSK